MEQVGCGVQSQSRQAEWSKLQEGITPQTEALPTCGSEMRPGSSRSQTLKIHGYQDEGLALGSQVRIRCSRAHSTNVPGGWPLPPEPSRRIRTEKETDPNPHPHRTVMLMEEAKNARDNKRVQEIMCWGVKSRRGQIKPEEGRGDFALDES